MGFRSVMDAPYLFSGNKSSSLIDHCFDESEARAPLLPLSSPRVSGFLPLHVSVTILCRTKPEDCLLRSGERFFFFLWVSAVASPASCRRKLEAAPPTSGQAVKVVFFSFFPNMKNEKYSHQVDLTTRFIPGESDPLFPPPAPSLILNRSILSRSNCDLSDRLFLAIRRLDEPTPHLFPPPLCCCVGII